MSTIQIFSISENRPPYVIGLLIAAACAIAAFIHLHDADPEVSSPAVNFSADEARATTPVNQVLGDESYVAAFGRFPTANISEQLRLQTHLAYVEQLLRRRSAEHLSSAQRHRRDRVLDHLQAYRQAGVFPRNTTHPSERTPVFIDREGRICAVGYLIEQTAGREVAERINSRYQFASIYAMDMPAIDRWAEAHGFTMRELAMIQPAYRHPDPEEERSVDKTLEGTLIGVTAAAAGVNGYMIAQSRRSFISGTAGLVAGGVTLGIGLSDRANFSAADITSASIAVLTSGWNLLRPLHDRTAESQSSAVVPRMQPATISTPDGGSKMGLQLSWEL